MPGSADISWTSSTNLPSLLSGIVGYFKLDETSGDAIDSVYGNHAVLNGGVTQNVSGKLNTCYTFISASLGYLLGGTIQTTSAFSYSCWIKLTIGAIQGIICPTSNYNVVPYFRINADGQLALVERNVGDIGLSVTTVASGVFTHVVVTYSPTGTWTFYINGTSTNSGTSLKRFTFDNLIIGAQGNGPSEYFNGQIDEVGIWNRALTAGEITTLYNGGTGLSYPF